MLKYFLAIATLHNGLILDLRTCPHCHAANPPVTSLHCLKTLSPLILAQHIVAVISLLCPLSLITLHISSKSRLTRTLAQHKSAVHHQNIPHHLSLEQLMMKTFGESDKCVVSHIGQDAISFRFGPYEFNVVKMIQTH